MSPTFYEIVLLSVIILADDEKVAGHLLSLSVDPGKDYDVGLSIRNSASVTARRTFPWSLMNCIVFLVENNLSELVGIAFIM